MKSIVGLLLFALLGHTVLGLLQGPPQPAKEFLGQYTLQLSQNNAPSLPFLGGQIAFYAGEVSRGLYLELASTVGAPMLLDTVITVTEDGQGYQSAGDGRCWFIGDVNNLYYILFLALLRIPESATFAGNTTVDGYVCSVWTWTQNEYPVSATVRYVDNALLAIEETNAGVHMKFSNVKTGVPPSSWFQKPVGNCQGQNSATKVLSTVIAKEASKGFGSFVHAMKSLFNPKGVAPVLPKKAAVTDPARPKLVQQFQSDYTFGLDVEHGKRLPLLDGHISLDYTRKSVRAVIQDDQHADMPFILQTTLISKQNPKNASDVQGYAFLGPGNCWQTPNNLLSYYMNFDFAIPEYGQFVKNQTINGDLCEVWQWPWNSGEVQQVVAVRVKDNALVQFTLVYDAMFFGKLVFTWENTKIVLGPVDNRFFNPPPGCVQVNE